MRRVVAVVVTASTVLLTVSPAYATFPGENGRIAFRRFFNMAHTHGAIFTINPDGTGLRQVTHPRRGVLTNSPAWSPNGRWIAYSRGPFDDSRIWKIRANGTHRTYLSGTCTGTCVSDEGPSFSPSGKGIAFARFAGSGCNVAKPPPGSGCLHALYVMRADGTHARRVTQRGASLEGTNRFLDELPQFSPSGKRLVFERADKKRFLGPGVNAHAIFTVRLDGTGVRRLTPWGLDGAQPDWSPDGRWILFRSQENGLRQNNIWLVHPNGTDRHRITHTFGGTYTWLGYSFSPNGEKITVARTPGHGKPGNADVYVMDVDGTGLRNVTNSYAWESAPDWGPQP